MIVILGGFMIYVPLKSWKAGECQERDTKTEFANQS